MELVAPAHARRVRSDGDFFEYMAITIEPNSSRAAERSVALGPGGAWHARAPRQLRKAYRSADGGDGWRAWQQHLAERTLKPAGKLTPSRRSALLWQLRSLVSNETRDLVLQLASSHAKGKELESLALAWIDAPAAAPLALAVESVAWAQALSRVANRLGETTWWRLLIALVTDASTAAWRADEPLASLISTGELPLTLSYAFPELAGCHALGEPARQVLTAAANEVWDGAGIVRSCNLPWLRPLVACWTRCRAVGEELADGWCDRQVARQFPQVIEHALRLTRADGRQSLSGDEVEWDAELIAAATRLAAAPSTRQVANLARDGRKTTRRVSGSPSPALESETAGLALLRPDWQAAAPRLTVAYRGEALASELTLGNDVVWSGPWGFEVRLNGQALAPTGHWEQVCWVSDDEVDYLELSLDLEQEVVVERHILLGRSDRFAIVADAVLGIGEAELEYRTTLPLTGQAQYLPETDTHEGTLSVRGKPRARALPLQLPEWRAGRGSGVLHATSQGLELRQQAVGQCLFAPLFLDLQPGRLRRPLTWRRLTVAQDRGVLPADSAVGYRVQIGDSQWLIYRSLSPPDVRSVLGVNLMHEFLVADFLPTGKIRRLLEIEPA
jgi:hypothetical protein